MICCGNSINPKGKIPSFKEECFQKTPLVILVSTIAFGIIFSISLALTFLPQLKKGISFLAKNLRMKEDLLKILISTIFSLGGFFAAAGISTVVVRLNYKRNKKEIEKVSENEKFRKEDVEKIPEELWIEILCSLEKKYLLSVFLTSKYFSKFIKSEYLLQKKAKEMGIEEGKIKNFKDFYDARNRMNWEHFVAEDGNINLKYVKI